MTAPRAASPDAAREAAAAVAAFRADIDRLLAEVGRRLVGQADVAGAVMSALLAGGHVLLEGVPGVAKTTLSKTFARVLGVQYQRIQFTPDLLPSDLTGGSVYSQREQEFQLKGCSKFIFPNSNALGYYRYDYDSAALHAMGNSVEGGQDQFCIRSYVYEKGNIDKL